MFDVEKIIEHGHFARTCPEVRTTKRIVERSYNPADGTLLSSRSTLGKKGVFLYAWYQVYGGISHQELCYVLRERQESPLKKGGAIINFGMVRGFAKAREGT